MAAYNPRHRAPRPVGIFNVYAERQYMRARETHSNWRDLSRALLRQLHDNDTDIAEVNMVKRRRTDTDLRMFGQDITSMSLRRLDDSVPWQDQTGLVVVSAFARDVGESIVADADYIGEGAIYDADTRTLSTNIALDQTPGLGTYTPLRSGLAAVYHALRYGYAADRYDRFAGDVRTLLEVVDQRGLVPAPTQPSAPALSVAA